MDKMYFKTPSSIKELVSELKTTDEKTYLVGGGTDLIIKIKDKRIYTGTIIDLKGIGELNYICQNEGMIYIGSNTTFTDIINSRILKKDASCLVQAAGQIGSVQIRNTATIGGNVANAFAGADAIPALMALDAKIKFINSNGDFFVKDIDEIILGLGKNDLGKDEAIVEVQIPVLGHGYRSAFGKVGSRTRVTIAKLNMAVVANVDTETNSIQDVRVVLGALGPKAFRSIMAEDALKGSTINSELKNQFQHVLSKQVDESISGRKSAPYKREAIKGLGEELFTTLFEDNGIRG